MDQNQITNQSADDDLQKAIDSITNNTNVDPVFAEPVAAPSSVPEGDEGKLDEPVGPFPEPKIENPIAGPDPKIEMHEPENKPEPIAPLEAMSGIPELSIPEPAPEAPTLPKTPEAPLTPKAPTISEAPKAPETSALSTNLDIHNVKESALRDLVPLLDHLNLDATKKFNLYRDVFEELKDYTSLGDAYTAAKDIPDETARAEALLYLVETIDKM